MFLINAHHVRTVTSSLARKPITRCHVNFHLLQAWKSNQKIMSDTDRSPQQASDADFCSQSRPESCVKVQSKIMCKTQHKLHPLPLHPALRTSAIVLIVTCAVVGYGSCSSWSTVRPSDVAPNSFGTFNFQELEEVVYDIEILKVPVPEPPPVDVAIDSTLDSKDSGGVADGDAERTAVDLPPSVGIESDERSEKTTAVDDSGMTHSEVLG